MFDPQSITGFAPALAAGALTSFHCVGMCGPLACAMQPSGGCARHGMNENLAAYHACRVVAYGLIGALAGWVGRTPFAQFSGSAAHYFPWALVAFLLVLGFGLEQKLPKPKFSGVLFFKASAKLRSLPGVLSGGALGLLTPFLPCGPLYLIFGVALLAGSPVKGAEFTLAFGLGTVPLLWVAQSQFLGWQQRWSPARMLLVRRGLAVVAAGMVAVRLLYPSEIKPANEPGAGACPMCPSHKVD